MATPEGKVKAKVKKTIQKYRETWSSHVFEWWPVPSGYGASKLDCLIHINGWSCWIETKRKGKEPTPRQKIDIVDIEKAGILVFVIDDVDDPTLDTLYNWLVSKGKIAKSDGN